VITFILHHGACNFTVHRHSSYVSYVSRESRVVKLVRIQRKDDLINISWRAMLDVHHVRRIAPYKSKIYSNEKTLPPQILCHIGRYTTVGYTGKVRDAVVSRFRRHQNAGRRLRHEAGGIERASSPFRYLGHVPSGPLGAFPRRKRDTRIFVARESHGHL